MIAQLTLGFLVAASWVPWWLSPGSQPRWVVLYLAVPLALLFVRLRPSPAHWMLAAWLAFSTASVLWSADPIASILWASRFALLAGAFCLGSALASPRWLMAGMSAGLVPAILTGSFFNPQFLAEVAAPLLAFGLLAPGWWRLTSLAAAPALFLANQPGATLASALAVAVFFSLRVRWLSLPFAAAAITAAAWVTAPASIWNRLEIWRDALPLLSPLGVGLGNFAPAYAALPSHTSTDFLSGAVAIEFAHNELLHFAVETGAASLLLVAVGCYALRGGWHDVHHRSPERGALLALGVSACIAFPFHDPAAGFLGAVLAGWLCRPRPAAGGDHHHG